MSFNKFEWQKIHVLAKKYNSIKEKFMKSLYIDLEKYQKNEKNEKNERICKRKTFN